MQVELIKMLIALFDTCDRVRIAHSLASSPSVNSMTWHGRRGVLVGVNHESRLPNALLTFSMSGLCFGSTTSIESIRSLGHKSACR